MGVKPDPDLAAQNSSGVNAPEPEFAVARADRLYWWKPPAGRSTPCAASSPSSGTRASTTSSRRETSVGSALTRSRSSATHRSFRKQPPPALVGGFPRFMATVAAIHILHSARVRPRFDEECPVFCLCSIMRCTPRCCTRELNAGSNENSLPRRSITHRPHFA